MPGAYRTSRDLIEEVLSRLGVLATGQAIDPEDFEYVQNSLDAVRRLLHGMEIAYIPDINNIPGEMFYPLADIVTGEVCTKFGTPPEDRQQLVMFGLGGVQGIDVGFGAAAIKLKTITRGRPTYEPLRVEYL